ncbi:HTH-type transcriptional activator Btr [Heyndrickxia sporothermodurans]|nr:HTH-type transcriptional activator Btr [Heyndrickxia sporothermodurans]
MKTITRNSENRQLNELMIRLIDAKKLKGDEAFQLNQQLSQTYLLIIITNGEGTIFIDNKKYRFGKNTFFFCAPEHTFGIFSTCHDIEIYLFHFDVFTQSKTSTDMILLKEEHLFNSKGIVHTSYSKGNLSFRCEEIVNQWLTNEKLNIYRSRFYYLELLYDIVMQNDVEEESSLLALERTKEYMDTHYNEKLNIEKLSKIAKLSPKYLVDLFKKTYGKSVIEYLTELKINTAKLMIAKGGLKLKEISKQIGYDDEFYFSRKFKKEVGVSPTVYMKKRSRKIAVYDRNILGHILALRIIPYAAPLHPKWTEYYYQFYSKDIPIHLNAYRHNATWEANIETLAHSNPEIVLVYDHLSEKEERQLNECAPILLKIPSNLRWREQFMWIADHLNVAEEAEHWMNAYRLKVENTRKKFASRFMQLTNFQMVILRVYKNHLYLHWNKGITSALAEDLQVLDLVKPIPLDFSEKISLQRLKNLNPHYICVLICHESETLSFWNQLQLTSDWLEIEAVQKNKVVHLPSDPWREYSAYAQSRMVDQAEKLFL